MQFLLSLYSTPVQYVLCVINISNLFKGPTEWKKMIIQTQYKYFSESHAPTSIFSHFGSKVGTYDEKKRRWKISRYCLFKQPM
jgi:hypothetical protein